MANRVATCTSYIRSNAMRVTVLDICGRPVEGDSSVGVSKSYVQIAYTANVEDGTAIDVRNADNEPCIYEAAKPRFLGYAVEIQFCNVDPELFSALTGQAIVLGWNGEVIGFAADSQVDVSTVNFALETWARTPGGADCDAEESLPLFGYFALPIVQGGVVTDFTLANSEVTFTVSRAATKDGNSYGTGLYHVVLDESGDPAVLPDARSTTEHLIHFKTNLEPPAPYCGLRPYLAPDGTEITSVTPTPTDLEVSFAVTAPTSDPFWIDFGDGFWDYSADGSALVYEYAEAGTYSYTAYRGGSVFTGTVTVTAP